MVSIDVYLHDTNNHLLTFLSKGRGINYFGFSDNTVSFRELKSTAIVQIQHRLICKIGLCCNKTSLTNTRGMADMS